MRESLDKLMDLIQKSRFLVAITGAGISTNAGIADFRSSNGIYRQGVSEELFRIESFRQRPEEFYRVFGPLYATIQKANPTYAHRVLRRLEELGRLKMTITQNIDGLHHRAGSQNVLEIHGHLRQWDCMSCRNAYEVEDWIEATVVAGEVPRCKSCGGFLKPHVVFFGEYVMGLEKAMQYVQKADLLLVIGSSLVVYPVAGLPSYRNEDAHLAILNKDATPIDDEADVVIHEDIDEALKQLGFL